ncbi:MAG: lysophospholipid acyltransferase family protein [Candidatus Lernaella stagnicola]|nr:lysophospholipid acyltransferase family protein [Candidatus Lernaella stagnicola]
MIQAIRNVLVITGIVLSTLVFAMSAVAFMLVGIKGRLIDRHATIWSRTVAWIAGMKLQAFGKQNVDPQRTYVVVVNHRSHLDTTVLYVQSPVPIRMLAKASLFKIPVLGWCMTLAGQVPVHRDEGKTDMVRLERDVDRLILEAGRSLCVFPEGTRQQPGEFGDYKMGAFIMAKEFDLPILPVSVEDTGKILPAKIVRFRKGEVKLRFHPPIAAEGKTVDELAAETKCVIEAGCLALRG